MSHSVDIHEQAGTGPDDEGRRTQTSDTPLGSPPQGDLFRTGGDQQQIGYDRRTVVVSAPEKKGKTTLVILGVVGAVGAVAATATAVAVLAKDPAPAQAKAPKGADACAPPNIHVADGFVQYRDFDASKVEGPLKTSGYEITGDVQADLDSPKEWVAVTWKDTMQQLGGYGIVFQDMRQGGEAAFANLDPNQLVVDADGNMTVYVPVGRYDQRIMVYTVENPYRYPVGPATNQSFRRFKLGSTDPAAVAASSQGSGTCVVNPTEIDRTSGSRGSAPPRGTGTGDGGAEPETGGPTGDEGNVGITTNSYTRTVSLRTTGGQVVNALVTVTA